MKSAAGLKPAPASPCPALPCPGPASRSYLKECGLRAPPKIKAFTRKMAELHRDGVPPQLLS